MVDINYCCEICGNSIISKMEFKENGNIIINSLCQDCMNDKKIIEESFYSEIECFKGWYCMFKKFNKLFMLSNFPTQKHTLYTSIFKISNNYIDNGHKFAIEVFYYLSKIGNIKKSYIRDEDVFEIEVDDMSFTLYPCDDIIIDIK